MKSNENSNAQWIGCSVVFGASRDGRRVESIQISGALACFDRRKDLGEQAGAAVADWLSRQERVHGHRYHDAVISNIEVRTDDGRFLDGTKHGWSVLDHACWRKAIGHAGYRIGNNGLPNGWYALLPGVTEFNQGDESHNYIGFFSSEADLIEEIYERVVAETTVA
ncbi:hypothetical protein A8H39_00065 [Paraburkholderia fungorum]|uniref:hypothetical protein n=1 Tax=Paraburkholderia fungorum TaxID=134537 RepID=UPI000485477B|nr:hypothetical protein [Paraburkholderia fungorum]PNE59580.1 hypothetical protein A8H39_00065 [Paraburkholderia fungorum]